MPPDEMQQTPAPSPSSSRPVVALVAHEIHDHGGMERACAELLRRASGKVDFVVCCRDLAPELRPLVDWRRIRVPRRPMPLRFVLFFALAGLQLAKTSADVVHTVGAIVPNRIDLASIHFCHAGFRETAQSHFARNTHSPVRRMNSAIAGILALLAERWCYRRSRVRVLAAVSKNVNDELRRHYPELATALTPNGVDHDRFRRDPSIRREMRAEHAVGPDEVIVLFVGGDWSTKGLSIAIQGFARAQAQAAASLRLWVLGRGDERRFAALAKAHGVGEVVRFFGARTDPERFYQAADVFVSPSLYETFSVAALEACATGLPVVATDVGAVGDFTGGGEAGFLVERTPEAVGAALAQLASDPQLRGRLAREARGRSEAYTWERSVQSVVDLYDALMHGRADAGVFSARGTT